MSMVKNKFTNCISGFTLAEVLITLVVVGVIAAMTIPTLINTYRKSVVESKLKKSFSVLSNAVKRATADYGDISVWEFDNLENFLNKYMLPYISNVKGQISAYHTWNKCKLELADGTFWEISNPSNFNIRQYDGLNHPYIMVKVDINGDAKPNNAGYDQFVFYILPYSAGIFNTGDHDIAHDVLQPGVYYDGYNISKNELLNNSLRKCSDSCNSSGNCRYYCVALIAQNGWKIPNDYPLNL